MSPLPEPTSDRAMDEWIARELAARDPFGAVAAASERHRAGHAGCEVYPSTPGHFLGTLAAATGARRILEIGGGLGYSTLWLAHGSGTRARVDTIERDETHVAELRRFAGEYGFGEQITVHAGDDARLVPAFAGPYDLVFYDAAVPGLALAGELERLVRPGGAALISNVFLGRYVPDHPDLEHGAAFRHHMLESDAWLASFVNGKLLAIRR